MPQTPTMDREISPPPLKRRRIANTTTEKHTETQPPSPSLRIFSWNINGITPFIQTPITTFFTSTTNHKPPQTTPTPSLRTFLTTHSFPPLLLLQEVKIAPSDTPTQKALSSSIKRSASEPASNPDYITHFNLPHDPHNATGFGRKVHGVCSIIRKDFAEKHVETLRNVDWDAEGRVSVIETKGGGPLLDDDDDENGRCRFPKLAILNVYLPNGTSNPYRDSATGAIIGTRHDRKLAVHKLLQGEVRRLEDNGFGVVVAGDFNIACEGIDGFPDLRTFPRQHVLNRRDFLGRFLGIGGEGKGGEELGGSGEEEGEGDDGSRSLNMVDTFRSLHPDARGYSYYPRGRSFGQSCDRVDMVICSRSLAGKCTEAGMLATEADRGPSDHVPIFASFDVYEQPPQQQPPDK